MENVNLKVKVHLILYAPRSNDWLQTEFHVSIFQTGLLYVCLSGTLILPVTIYIILQGSVFIFNIFIPLSKYFVDDIKIF